MPGYGSRKSYRNWRYFSRVNDILRTLGSRDDELTLKMVEFSGLFEFYAF